MKKIFTFIIAMALSLNMLSQCPLSTAVDFTATDCHGTEVHLFDILDGGQYVLIDFFFYSCSACNTTAPYMVQAYTALGCNQHDVFFMEISDRDSDALCQTWTNNYGVEYPTISGAASGAAINDQYMIPAYPTVILIAPDHSIVINDLWPINNAQTVINSLAPYGIEQHDCNEPTEEVAFSVDIINIELGGCIEEPGMFTIYNETTTDLLIEDYVADNYVFACLDADIFLDGNDIKGMTIAPSDSLNVYMFFEGIIRNYEMNDTLHLTTSYGEYELPVLITVYEGINEVDTNNFILYPNPVNDYLTIEGENLGNVSVYNALGQVIFNTFGTSDLIINTADYQNGIYFVKIGNKIEKFVVTH